MKGFVQVYNEVLSKFLVVDRIKLKNKLDYKHENIFIQQLMRRSLVMDENLLDFSGRLELN